MTKSAKLDIDALVDANDQDTLQAVADFYHGHLRCNAEMQHFLATKRLDEPSLNEHFRLGYANRSLGLQLPLKITKSGKTIRERLMRLGVYRKTGREHLNGSLVVPVLDLDGNIVELYGRKVLGQRLRKGTPLELFINEPPRGVFNLEVFPQHDEMILCASFLDALTFWSLGFRHVSTSYHAGALHPDLREALTAHGVTRVILAHPRLAESDAHTESLSEALSREGIEAFRAVLPRGMTANQFCVRTEGSVERFAELVRRAVWLDQGKLTVMTATEMTTLEQAPRVIPSAPAVESAPEPEPMAPIPESPLPTRTIPHEHATPVPQATEPPDLTVLEHEIQIPLGDRRYRVRGFDPKGTLASMRLNLMVRRDETDTFFQDKLDLYSQRARANFVHKASGELGLKDDIVRHDLGRIILALEGVQEDYHHSLSQPHPRAALTSKEREEALALLRDPALLDRILTDFQAAGVVGEDANKLVGYLACTSRMLPKPIAVVVQSSSAAGKSSLMDSILAFMPEEEKVQYSAMTGQSLYYFQTTSLKHKILAIAEEEGVDRVSYALKLLQSEAEITIASTGKDVNNGNLITQSYTVEGPIQLFMTTTSIDVDEELMNRCLVLSVDESREQTEQIHVAQRRRRTLKGLEERLAREATLTRHRNAQRLLKPVHVVNPYAEQLGFVSHGVRTRRDHEKYLNLIDAIALLHQYQRAIRTMESGTETVEYIEVAIGDIEVANRLAHEVLGRTLDELPPQSRKLLRLISEHVHAECRKRGIEQRHYRFTRKTIREHTGWSNSALKVHMKRLEDMEYLLVLRGGRGQSYEYELLSAPESPTDRNCFYGLFDLAGTAGGSERSGHTGEWSGPSSGQVSPKPGGRSSGKLHRDNELCESGRDEGEAAVPEGARSASKVASYSPVEPEASEG